MWIEFYVLWVYLNGNYIHYYTAIETSIVEILVVCERVCVCETADDEDIESPTFFPTAVPLLALLLLQSSSPSSSVPFKFSSAQQQDESWLLLAT